MSREKHIDEMAKDLCHKTTCSIKKEDSDCYKYCNAYIYAFRAINAGYRKQSEGEWVWIADDSPMCNICGNVFDTNDNADAGTGLWKYCPNCGAKMKGGAG